MRSAAKLASAESMRQIDMLLIAEYMPMPSASSSPIESTWKPAAAGVAQRPQRPTAVLAATDARLTTAGRRSRPARPPADRRDDHAPLESSITRSATRAISRLCVTTNTARPVWACACSSSRICTPVRKSSSPVGSSASRIGLPLRQRPRDRHALLLAAGELVREVRQCDARDPRDRASPRDRARGWSRPATSAPNSTFSSASAPGRG